MIIARPYTEALERLKSMGLRPTRQRMALARILFEAGDRHITAEQLHTESQAANVRVSLATIYNTLHQFTEVGLLNEVVVEPGRSYFDTNVSNHHHFYNEETGELVDIRAESIRLDALPESPEGTDVRRVDVIIRVRSAG
ncbi:MAG: transcriptional repressor [Alphaproteobacteria bacterium]|nr:transcriptional repressor [Alphaproteobacteria bacterium]